MATILLWIVGCGGSGLPGNDAASRWTLSGPSSNRVSCPKGGQAKFTITGNHKSGTFYDVALTTTEFLGWTIVINPANFRIDAGNAPTAEVTITPPANLAEGSEQLVGFTGTDTGGLIYSLDITVVISGGSNKTTGIAKDTDFEHRGDGLFASRFRVINGPPGDLIGSLQYTFLPNVLYWYRPNNDLDEQVNTEKECELVAVALKSTIPGPHTVEAKFNKAGTPYSYTSSFTAATNANVDYEFTSPSGLSNTSIGNQASFNVTIDLPSGKPGNYSLFITGGGLGITKTVSPSSIAIDALGNPVTFTVTVTRTSEDAGRGTKTHEFLVEGIHDANPECNLRQIMGVYAVRP